MLHWQLRKWLSGYSLKTKIIFASVIGHLFALFSLFVLYHGNEQYHILITGTMINTDVPIVFLPMHKSLKQMGGSGKTSDATANSSKTIQTQKVFPVAAKGTIAAALPETKSKKSSKKIKTKKESKNKSKKESKKLAEEKKVEEKQKKEEPKPIEPEKAIETPKQEQIVQAENPAILANAAGIVDNNVLYVGQQEMDALQLQDYIQQEMAQHWSPPAGMKKNISCIIKVTIAFDGAISNVDVEQSSGVLIFDGAAKRAAAQLTPPQWAYGKEIFLTFKP